MYRLFASITISMLLLVGFGVATPMATQAATTKTCECYCAIEDQGATRYPKNSEAKVTVADCQEVCREAGYSVAACAFDASQKPQSNINCFEPEECTKQNGEWGKTQPGECKSGMRYCYPDPSKAEKVPLQVHIGSYTASGDIGEYISTVYKWLVGVATTIAIVFLMVAGLRWSLGGLSADQVGKAKKTISNSIIGLVLLLSTYVILLTINPHLVNLQVPEFPMIKSVSVVGEGSCGYLRGWWGDDSTGHYEYLIKNGAPLDSPYAVGQPAPKGGTGNNVELANHTNGEQCGSVADVEVDWQGNRVADDQTCTFDYCPEAEDSCFVTSGEGYCLSCSDFGLNASPPIPASFSVCSQLHDPQNDRGCVFVSTSTFSSNILGSVLSFAGYSSDLADGFEDQFCFSCGGKTCSSITSQELCRLDPCSLGCEWEIGVDDFFSGGTTRAWSSCVKR